MSRHRQKFRNHVSTGGPPVTSPKVHQISGESDKDFANRLTPKVRVSCYLTSDSVVWRTYRTKAVAIFHLKLIAREPPGYKLANFEVNIAFQQSRPASTTTEEESPVRLLQQSPSPSTLPVYIEGRPWSETQARGTTVDPELQVMGSGGHVGSYHRTTEKSVSYKWQFTSVPVPNENNDPTGATWTWRSNKINPQVENRGILYGAVTLRCPGEDLIFNCHVTGRLCQGSRWWWFGDEKSEPAHWRIDTPKSATADIEDKIRGLKVKIDQLNTAAVTSK